MSFRGLVGGVFAAYSPARAPEAVLVRQAAAMLRPAGAGLSDRSMAAILARRVAECLVAGFDSDARRADIRFAIALGEPIERLAFDEALDAASLVRAARRRLMDVRGWRWPSACERAEADRAVIAEVARKLSRRYREMLGADFFGREGVGAANAAPDDAPEPIQMEFGDEHEHDGAAAGTR